MESFPDGPDPVTAEAFARTLCIGESGHLYRNMVPENARRVAMDLLRSRLETQHIEPQLRLLSEFAAKYLPALYEAWKTSEGAFNSHTIMLNLLASSGIKFFSRFLETGQATDMTAIQVKRMAGADYPDSYNAEDIAEIGQFLSSLLGLQGPDHVHQNDVKVVVPKLRVTTRKYLDQFPGETTQRCYDFLRGDRTSRAMHRELKVLMETGMNTCSAPNCTATVQTCSTMMQCARCKVTRYCSTRHQKLDWPDHKITCFGPCF